jgi:hypothetical protein
MCPGPEIPTSFKVSRDFDLSPLFSKDDSRTIRQQRIDRVTRRLRARGKWLCFEDIAERHAREKGIIPDEVRRLETYSLLLKDLSEGYFDKQHVWYLRVCPERSCWVAELSEHEAD